MRSRAPGAAASKVGRRVTFAACSSVATAALIVLAACSRASPTTSSPGYDVYVPMPGDGGDASVTADTGAEGGFALGRIDRAGRPLVAVLLVPGVSQDAYNAEGTFAASLPRVQQDGIASRIATFDTLVLEPDAGPDPVDWPDGGALLPMILADTLLVDTALPCTGGDGGFVSSYLDLEQEAFLSSASQPPYRHSTCGGRTPSEDVIDKTLTLLVTADRDGGPPVSQTVSGPTQVASTMFPYLAPPN